MKIPTAERLIDLAVYLLKEKRPRTLREIIEQVEGYDAGKEHEASRRMFIRDRKTLAELDIPVRMVGVQDPDTGHETEGYTIAPEDFYVPEITFSEGEVSALLGLGKRISGAADAPPFSELGWALTKITSAGGRQATATSEGSSVVINFESGGGTRRRNIEAVQAAIAERKVLDAVYMSAASGRPTKRKIEPYGLYVRRGQWYLVGFCRLRKEIRTFRLDRLEPGKVKSDTGAQFEMPENFSLSEYISKRAPWEFGGDAAKRVTIKLHPDIFWQVKNAWGDLDTARFNDADSTVVFNSVNDDSMLRWALAFGDRAEVLAPESMRGKMKKMLGEIAANARTQG